MKIGFARVSTRDQNLELQLDALTQAGCELIYQEKASGALAVQVEPDKLLLQVRPGDTVYIYKLDRLAVARAVQRQGCHFYPNNGPFSKTVVAVAELLIGPNILIRCCF